MEQWTLFGKMVVGTAIRRLDNLRFCVAGSKSGVRPNVFHGRSGRNPDVGALRGMLLEVNFRGLRLASLTSQS